MSHRTDAEGSLRNVQQTLAEIEGRPTPTDVSIANAARAQAIAAVVNDAIGQRFPDELIGINWDGFSVADEDDEDDEGWPGRVLPCGITYVNGEPTT